MARTAPQQLFAWLSKAPAQPSAPFGDLYSERVLGPRVGPIMGWSQVEVLTLCCYLEEADSD